jgi:hypothetical protein
VPWLVAAALEILGLDNLQVTCKFVGYAKLDMGIATRSTVLSLLQVISNCNGPGLIVNQR